MTALEVTLIGAIVGALIGSIVSFVFTISLRKKRESDLEKSLYNEFALIRNRLNEWLLSLIDEYKNPKRLLYSEYSPFNTYYLDAICIEMVKANRIIRTDQRNLIENIKIKSGGILFNLSKIDNYKKEIQIDGNKGSYRAPKSTAYLILDATEIVYYLTKLLNEKEDFVLESIHSKELMLRDVFEKMDVDLKSISIGNIIKDVEQ